MRRWGVVLAMAAVAACAKEKKEEPARLNKVPAMSADTSHPPDSTMMRDTARTPAAK